jgi:hypothetical protein
VIGDEHHVRELLFATSKNQPSVLNFDIKHAYCGSHSSSDREATKLPPSRHKSLRDLIDQAHILQMDSLHTYHSQHCNIVRNTFTLIRQDNAVSVCMSAKFTELIIYRATYCDQ